MEELIHKGQAKSIELKLMNEKFKILELQLAEKESIGTNDLEQQISMEKDRIFERLQAKEQQLIQKEQILESKLRASKLAEEELAQLRQKMTELEKEKYSIGKENNLLMEELKKSATDDLPKVAELKALLKEKDSYIKSQSISMFQTAQI